ncbi:MAG: hypothetical protein ACXWL2_03520 [Candidatus Chromulinivorax sp.]
MKKFFQILCTFLLCSNAQASQMPIGIQEINYRSRYDASKTKNILTEYPLQETGFSYTSCMQLIANKDKNYSIKFIRNLKTNEIIGVLVSSTKTSSDLSKTILDIEVLTFNKEITQKTQDEVFKKIYSKEEYIGVITNFKKTNTTYKNLLSRHDFNFRESKNSLTSFQAAYKVFEPENKI